MIQQSLRGVVLVVLFAVGAMASGCGAIQQAASSIAGALIEESAPVHEPQRVELDGRFVEAVAGARHTCALDEDGALFCWGRNDHGQLGTGEISESSEPVPAAGQLRFRSVAAGADHTCAISTDGRSYCWGRNHRGQLGTGDREASLIPAPVDTPFGFERLYASGHETCGLTDAGETHCWGGTFFIAALNDHTPQAVPSTVRFSALSLSPHHRCALGADGSAHCWGSNRSGALGIGEPRIVRYQDRRGRTFRDYDQEELSQGTPRPVANVEGVAVVATMDGESCAALTGGGLYCWGGYDAERASNLPEDSPRRAYHWTPVRIQTPVAFTHLTGGEEHICGLADEGRIYCWGRNRHGQLASDTRRFGSVDLPARVAVPGNFNSLSAGGRHTCGVDTEGAVWCWGENNVGQVGFLPATLAAPDVDAADSAGSPPPLAPEAGS